MVYNPVSTPSIFKFLALREREHSDGTLQYIIYTVLHTHTYYYVIDSAWFECTKGIMEQTGVMSPDTALGYAQCCIMATRPMPSAHDQLRKNYTQNFTVSCSWKLPCRIVLLAIMPTVKILIICALLFFAHYHFSSFDYAVMVLIGSRTWRRLTASNYSRMLQ